MSKTSSRNRSKKASLSGKGSSSKPKGAVGKRDFHRFFSVLDPKAEAFNFRTFSDKRLRSLSKGSNRDSHAKSDRLKVAQAWRELKEKNALGAGIFVVINEGGAKKSDITRVRAVFADQDNAGARINFDGMPSPHFIVESSPGKFHYYWMVENLAIDNFAEVQKALALRFGTDKSVNDLSRVMRVPGFYHQKHERFRTRIVEDNAGSPYPASKILEAISKFGGAPASGKNPNASAVSVGRGTHAGILKMTHQIASKCIALGLDRSRGRQMLVAVRKKFGKREPGELERALDGAFKKLESGDLLPSSNALEREVVVHGIDSVHLTTDSIERILIAAEVPIYRRGTTLVRPGFDASVAGELGRDRGAPLLINVENSWITDQLSRLARCVTRRIDDGIPRDKGISWPREAIQGFFARRDQLGFLHLRGTLEIPLLRKNGKIRFKSGYDEATQLLLSIPNDWPKIDKRPGQEQAAEALKVIKEVLATFPFRSDADLSVLLSAILTLVSRHLYRTAPMHAISAPVRGSGKSLLVEVCALIATGRIPPMLAWGKNDDEASKRLGAALLKGDSLVCFDNVESAISGDMLCQALTQESMQVRILGESSLATIPLAVTFMATGNNLTLKGDMTRRALVAEIDPRCEHPEQRPFERRPREYVKKHRSKLVNAALTILSAYLRTAPPELGPTFGSFEGWSSCVRGALLWLGCADPIIVTKRTDDLDPERLALRQLMRAWKEQFGSNPMISSEVLRKGEEQKHENSCLMDALESAAVGPNGKSNAKSLGRFLAKHKGRVVDGLCFSKQFSKSRDGSIRWKLVEQKPK